MSSTAHTPNDQPVKRSTGRLVLGWVLVGIPLAYGVFQTLTQVAALFG
ncbi:MFS transporter small subunit [Arthrobacter sedimenti]|uniref:Oxalate:formate antiporter n=1 Tax=Arthrobacter sedimenti TaxID=2694931 RepID=A0ABV8WFP2_9MICC